LFLLVFFTHFFFFFFFFFLHNLSRYSILHLIIIYHDTSSHRSVFSVQIKIPSTYPTFKRDEIQLIFALVNLTYNVEIIEFGEWWVCSLLMCFLIGCFWVCANECLQTQFFQFRAYILIFFQFSKEISRCQLRCSHYLLLNIKLKNLSLDINCMALSLNIDRFNTNCHLA